MFSQEDEIVKNLLSFLPTSKTGLLQIAIIHRKKKIFFVLNIFWGAVKMFLALSFGTVLGKSLGEHFGSAQCPGHIGD
jgi:urea transporter